MELTVSAVMTAVTNLIVFSAVPFLWWFFRRRRQTGFGAWIGFIRPRLKTGWWVLAIFAVVYYFFYNFDFTTLIGDASMEALESSGSIAVNVYAGLGAAAILPAFIENFVANGVAEEILYRGFLCKRLCGRFGAVRGVILQAVLFGAMHNLLYLAAGIPVGADYHILMFLFTGTAALLLGFLNEKIYNGSIIPSILLHGAGNFIATMAAAFGLW